MTASLRFHSATVLMGCGIALGALLLGTGRSVLGQEPAATSTAEAPAATPTAAPGAEPSVFSGSVTFRGEPLADGTPIEALMGPELIVCGSTTASGGRYTVGVAGDTGQPGCGRDGDLVFFRGPVLIGREHGQFHAGTVQQLDLSFISPVAFLDSGFFGSVTVNGQPAPDGTPIEALIGDVVCGTTRTTAGQYRIGVSPGFGFGDLFQEGCAGSGPGTYTVVFRSGTLIASERGRFVSHVVQGLDLTFGQALAPTETPPPALPDTGSAPTSQTTAATAWLLWVLLGVGIAALMARLAARRVAR